MQLISNFGRSLAIILAPGLLIGAVALIIVIGFIGQTSEILRSLAEPERPDWLKIISAALMVQLLGLMMFVWHRVAVEFTMSRSNLHLNDTWIAASIWISLLLASIPSLALVIGFENMLHGVIAAEAALIDAVATHRNAQEAADAALSHIDRIQSRHIVGLLLIFSVWASLMFLLGIRWIRRDRLTLIAMRWDRPSDQFERGCIIFSAFLVLVFGIGLAIFNLTFAHFFTWFGALATGLLVALLLFSIFLAIGSISNFVGAPGWVGIASVVMVYYALANASAFVLPDPKHADKAWQKSATFQDFTKNWTAKRGEGQAIVVSAQGGGIYAAIASSLTLSRLNTADQSFHKRLFAISGVSGGSIGASLHVAETALNGCFSTAGPSSAKLETEHKLRDTLLAPYFAAIVGNLPADGFRKFLQPFMQLKDRSDAFTDVLHAKCPKLTTPLHEIYETEQAPTLILNTTWMANAHRVVFAPMGLNSKDKTVGDGTLWSFADLFNHRQPEWRGSPFSPTLGEAAATSARFPFALPPLSLSARNERYNFGDGGYADGSGVATGLELYTAIRRSQEPLLKPYLLMVTFRYEEVKPEKGGGTSFTDFYSPIRAILGVRENLSGKSVTRAINQVNANQRSIIAIDTNKFHIGLGLQLSRTSYEVLSLLIGKPEWCDRNKPTESGSINGNSCALQDVIDAI